MFRLTIDLPPAPIISAHRDRETAVTALSRHLGDTGHTPRVAWADWTHTRYDILGHRALAGCALIDEVCGCTHTHREHDDIGCTITVFDDKGLNDCGCRTYAPVSHDPALFDLEVSLTAPGPT
jgi:hypothetical protein